MLMPETAMNENDFSAAGKHEVGFAGKITPVEPKPVSEPVHGRAHGQFRFGVRGFDRLHVSAPGRADGWGRVVHGR